MATWSLSPQHKKSAVEKMFFFKDGKIITIEQGYRWATFKIESDICPMSTAELKNEDGYELDGDWEMWDMIDGCWIDIESHCDATEEDVEAFTAAWEEDSYEGVEALGWSQDECEYYYFGPLELTNESTGEVFKGEPDEEVPPLPEAPSMTLEEKLEVIREIEEEKSVHTDWFPVSINPVRNGTYQTLETEVEVMWPFVANIQYSVWDGKTWDKTHVVKWRGLAKDPTQ